MLVKDGAAVNVPPGVGIVGVWLEESAQKAEDDELNVELSSAVIIIGKLELRTAATVYVTI